MATERHSRSRQVGVPLWRGSMKTSVIRSRPSTDHDWVRGLPYRASWTFGSAARGIQLNSSRPVPSLYFTALSFGLQ